MGVTVWRAARAPHGRTAQGALIVRAQYPSPHADLKLATQGQRIVRFDTFGDEQPWTDPLRLHEVVEASVDGAYAARTVNKAYRTIPLRGLWQHPPYFHDGSAATLADVVAHYDRVRNLQLSEQQERELVEYLKTL